MQSLFDSCMHKFSDLSNRLLVITLLLRELIDILLLPFRPSKDVFAMVDELLFVQVSLDLRLIRLSWFLVLGFWRLVLVYGQRLPEVRRLASFRLEHLRRGVVRVDPFERRRGATPYVWDLVRKRHLDVDRVLGTGCHRRRVIASLWDLLKKKISGIGVNFTPPFSLFLDGFSLLSKRPTTMRSVHRVALCSFDCWPPLIVQTSYFHILSSL